MSGTATSWVGGALAIAAVTGLLTYFSVVGLDDANKIAGVLGLFVALAGLWLTWYGARSARGTSSHMVLRNSSAHNINMTVENSDSSKQSASNVVARGDLTISSRRRRRG